MELGAASSVALASGVASVVASVGQSVVGPTGVVAAVVVAGTSAGSSNSMEKAPGAASSGWAVAGAKVTRPESTEPAMPTARRLAPRMRPPWSVTD
jgi:hypothetical protein